MQFIILDNKKLPIKPEGIKIIETFGDESIVNPDNGNIIEQGVVTLIEADSETIRQWLGNVDGVWISDNPMWGKWKVVHIKK